MQAQQMSLLGCGAPAIDETFSALRRVQLDDTAWVEHAPSWVEGHQALMDELVRTTRWQSQRREMYERTVDVPRLTAALPDDGPGHPLFAHIQRALAARYGTTFEHVSLGYYRNGGDSVAWHGDYVARNLPEALVATVSLGEPRRFLLRPRGGGRRSLALSLGWGDLLVMGGSCQRTWEHAVPKVARAEPRVAVMFRPTWYQNGNAETK
jgi:alkylated DNA repair dioxygenase AlkB